MRLTLDGCPFRTGAQLATWLAEEPGLSLALLGLRPIPVYVELHCATVFRALCYRRLGTRKSCYRTLGMLCPQHASALALAPALRGCRALTLPLL